MCPFEELLLYVHRKFAGRSKAVQCAARAIAVDDGFPSGLQGYGLVSYAKLAAVGRTRVPRVHGPQRVHRPPSQRHRFNALANYTE